MKKLVIILVFGIFSAQAMEKKPKVSPLGKWIQEKYGPKKEKPTQETQKKK